MQNDETTMRERLLTMRMSDEEHSRALLVANHYGLNIAGVVRMLLKREETSIAAVTASPMWIEPKLRQPKKKAPEASAMKPKKKGGR